MEPNAADGSQLEEVIDEFTAALRRGEQPSISAFQTRFPELASELAEVLSSVAMLEQLKSASELTLHQANPLDSVSGITHVGPYRIVREIGRGGMGIVFEAVHESLGRQVAVKVMPTPLLDAQQCVQRFQHEAQAAARLHHTNIVSVFASGEGLGYHYYVMDFVDGTSLSVLIQRLRNNIRAGMDVGQTEGEPPAMKPVAQYPWETVSVKSSFAGGVNRYQWAAGLARQLAEGLAYAHDNHILHRDLKPANLILDTSGRLWITDFGLAKDAAREIALTRTGDIVGTPQYLPPEALEGRYDVRSEIYGVGLVLYELLALQPAHAGASPAELIRRIAAGSPPFIRKVVPEVPLDLATIIDKSLARDPANRYRSAGELARDLTAFVEHRAISARRPNLLETGWRWAKRNRLAASLTLTSAVLLLLVAATSTVGYVTTTSALRKEAAVSQSLRAQQAQTEQAKQAAESNLQAMQMQFDRAEANVALSIEAMEGMFRHLVSGGHPVSDSSEFNGLREISGIETSLTTEDAEFLDGLVHFYERFAQLNAGNAMLLTESAKAYRRAGNIHQIVGQLPDAIAAYEKSVELQQAAYGQLSADISDSSASELKARLLGLVRTQNELSSAYRRAGQLMLAQEWNSRSISLLEESPLVATEADVKLELARTLSALGFDVLRAVSSTDVPGLMRPEFGNRPAAMQLGKRLWDRFNRPLASEAIEILDELLEAEPSNQEYAAVRASCYWCLAAADLRRDQAQGFTYRRQAIEALDELVRRSPDNREYQYLLALACNLVLPNPEPAELELVERGAGIMRLLVEAHPAVLDYHHLYAKLQIKLADYSILQQQRERALVQLKLARSSIQVLVWRASSDRSFAVTMSALVRELMQLERMFREAQNPRAAGEISQLLKQIHQARRGGE